MNKKKSQSYVGRAVKDYFTQNWGILLGLLILCVIFSVFGNNFLTQKNILNLLRTCATNCFLAIGVQMAIILAGIDLTGGALAALSEDCLKVLYSFCSQILQNRTLQEAALSSALPSETGSMRFPCSVSEGLQTEPVRQDK